MKTNTLQIQPAGKQDLETLQQLAYEIWPIYYQAIISMDQIEYMLRLFSNPQYLEQQIHTGTMPFLAFENETPIGYLALTPAENQKLKLDKLYLLPETRGKGYGIQMLRFAENHARHLKSTSLILNVNRFNPTLHFYKKQGFQTIQQIDIPLGPFWLFDFIMEKHL